MKNFSKLLGAVGIGLLISAPHAQAQDFSSCKALSNADAYSKKYENYQYLIPGQNGWFFRTKQDLWTKYSIKRNIPMFQDFANALRARGTDLVIAYMPTRGLAARGKLPQDNPLVKDFNPQTVQKSYESVVRTMNANGIHTVGLSDLSQGDTYFYKADHHWSRAGAQAMAKALAESMNNLESYKELPKEKFALVPDEKPAKIEGSFNAVLDNLCNAKTPAQEDQMVHTQGGADDENALFGNETFPAVALVGTSNSKKQNNDVHFDDLLKAELNTDVYNAAISGGGIDDSMLSYLASASYQKNPAKILIWEIPGYYDLDGEDMRKLLTQASAAARGSCAAPAQVATAAQKLQAQNVSLFSGLRDKKLEDGYVYMKFNKPFRKKFSIETSYTDGKADIFRFERSKLYPADGIFYYKLPQGKPISSVSLKIPSNMHGMTLNAQLCTPSLQTAEVHGLKNWWQKVRH